MLWLAYRVISLAWVTDDAYITFRVIDNIVHGYGAVWNIGDRVQSFTHPLWMLLHVPFYALFGNIYLTTLVISFTCFALAVYVTMRNSGKSLFECALCFVLPLSLFLPVVVFATSGLENVLSMLLISIFYSTLWKGMRSDNTRRSPPSWLFYSSLSALIFLNRLDLIFILTPAWLWLLWQHKSSIRIRPLVVGGLPLVAWFMFSLWYYGFIFPNTKYAKLNTGIPQHESIQYGINYLMDLFITDTLSFCALIAVCGSAFYYTTQLFRRSTLSSSQQLCVVMATGILLQVVYTVAIGGDFMSGRFFSIPLFAVAMLILYITPIHLVDSLPRMLCWVGILFISFAFHGDLMVDFQRQFCITRSDPYCKENKDTIFIAPNGIIDERNYYLNFLGLWTSAPFRTEPQREWVDNMKRQPVPLGITVIGAAGVLGYYFDRQEILIDRFALTDILLARLPMREYKRTGHFERDLPDGYLKARKNGDIRDMDEDLGAYYKALRMITTGPLWSAERLRTIMDFQLGRYDSLRQSYITRHCATFYMNCSRLEVK